MYKKTQSPSPQTQWKALYSAAILETDKNAIPEKLNLAEAAVLARGREIFYSPANLDENGELEDALYCLRAFRTALRHGEAA